MSIVPDSMYPTRGGRGPTKNFVSFRVGDRRGHLVIEKLNGARARMRCDCGATFLIFVSQLWWYRPNHDNRIRMRCGRACSIPPRKGNQWSGT